MEFIEIIKKNRNLRRLFGRQELKIIEKQLLGVRLEPSERTRLSRDIKKKFEVVASLTPFINEFKLKKGAEIKRIIEDTKEVILGSIYLPKIRKIFLFGSAVENELTFNSDIDIAVEFDSVKQTEATKFKIYISSRVNDKVDIQVYNLLPEKIKKEIDKKGKMLYERKEKKD